MKTNITTLRVLVASPGDTKEERSLVSGVISDINQMIGQKEGFRLEHVLWEEHAYPDIGEDAQDVINRQLKDYDFFLGIMSSRFGTPTKRADSGTEEEFDRAFQRHLTAPNSIKILFYFHNPKLKIFDLDPYQLLQVHNFRNRLKALGVLYEVYDTTEEFRQKLSRGLGKSVRAFLTERKKTIRKRLSAPRPRELFSARLPDWKAETNSNNMSVFPQWARYREIPIKLFPCHQLAISGNFQSPSKFFRFGFKLLPIRERPFGSGSIQSEGNNLVIHIGKNSSSERLFVTSYYNGLRRAADKHFSNYKTHRNLQVKFSVREDNVAELFVEKRVIFQAHISPEIKNRLLILAWGDEHDYEVSFSNIKLEYA